MAIVEASTISKNRVLDPAEVPYREEWPKLWLALASAPLGLLFGAIAVLFRALFSSRLQSGADIPIHFGRVPLFATIPHFSGKTVTAEAGALAEAGSPLVLEAFRTLRTNLCYACSRERGNVVLITSPCDGDGKTTSAYSLASALARAGRPVLLVDANLRQGVLPGEGNPPECGDLTSILEGRDAWREVVRQVNVTPEGPFHVIRSGGPASSELLSGVSMRNFITDARGCYDFVLVDAPSYPVVSDALVLASMADCILSVVRPQHTSKKQASENIRRLWVGGVVYGLVLNDVRA
jgi:tyrosine-protein kinase Etk/Wzc